MNAAPLLNLGQTTFKLAAPLLLAALGETVVERAGVINVGIEGMMLTGACAAFGVASFAGNWIVALAAGCAAGVAMAALFALAAIKFRADQVVVGTAINILAMGVTGVYSVWRQYFAGSHVAVGEMSAPLTTQNVASVPHFTFVLHGLTVLQTSPVGIFAYLMAPVCALYFARTNSGLRLIATGEYPEAAADAGVNIARARILALLFGGLMAGLGGAYLSIDNTVTFDEGMTGGIGFVALAVVIVGRWQPLGVLLASLLFSAASALQFDFQALNLHIPQQALLALPYVLTLVALVVRSGRSAAPAALGQPVPGG